MPHIVLSDEYVHLSVVCRTYVLLVKEATDDHERRLSSVQRTLSLPSVHENNKSTAKTTTFFVNAPASVAEEGR